MENKHGDSGEFDAPSSNENDSDDDDVNRHSPGDDEAQDSPGPGMTPATFDPDVSKPHIIKPCKLCTIAGPCTKVTHKLFIHFWTLKMSAKCLENRIFNGFTV